MRVSTVSKIWRAHLGRGQLLKRSRSFKDLVDIFNATKIWGVVVICEIMKNNQMGRAHGRRSTWARKVKVKSVSM